MRGVLTAIGFAAVLMNKEPIFNVSDMVLGAGCFFFSLMMVDPLGDATARKFRSPDSNNNNIGYMVYRLIVNSQRRSRDN